MLKKRRKEETIRQLRGYPTLAEAFMIANRSMKKISDLLDQISEVTHKNGN